MTSPLCVATGGWCRRVFHYRPPTPMYRNSPPLCTIVLQIPSLMPLKMRKVQFWLVEYFPECMSLPSEIRAPSIEDLQMRLAVQTVAPVPVPADCIDGFAGAYWCRPESYLDPSVRAGISSLAQLPAEVAERCVQRSRQDLASGEWDAHYGYLRELTELDLGYRLLIAQ